MAVAQAAGIAVRGYSGISLDFDGSRPLTELYIDGTGMDFKPSTDLNDAFIAAEKMGLLNGRKALGRTYETKKWAVGSSDRDNGDFCADFSEQETPELALCAAVIERARCR
jgi:hypothetical protein